MSGAAAAQQENPPVTLTAEERAFLAEHGPLRVWLGPTGAPLTVVQPNGTLRGIHMDLLNLMTIRLGIEFNVTVAPSVASLLDGLNRGETDIVGPVVISPSRTDEYGFTEPYYVAPVGFWVSDRYMGPESPDALVGLRVGATSPAWIERLAQQYPALEPVLVNGPEEAVTQLAGGNLDAVYMGYASASYYARLHGLTNVYTFTEPDQLVESQWAASLENPMVLGLLRKGMSVIPREERLQIDFKWAGMDLAPPVVPDTPAFYETAGFRGTAGGLLVLVGVLVAWSGSLRVQVNRRTRELRVSENRLRQRTRQLETAIADVESFNYSVSHDLRTPLRTINGFAELLGSAASLPPDERTRYLQIIRAESRRLSEIVESLLDLSRTSRAELRRRELDVTTMAQRVLARLQQGEPTRPIVVSVDAGLRVFADPAQTEVVLENLLGNAWKFTQGVPEPRIHVGAGDGPGSFIVKDNGVGFDPDQPDLFQPFRRFHGSDAFEGHGIGLATVHRIVARHEGTLEVMSRPGEGTAVAVHFPPAPVEATRRPLHPLTAPTPSG